ncbi:MAG: S26 family signal peptidase [Candidatus Omnitrophica bacterium]|nr:S26 family signal peptidase [Candidatus Omnitrophota bacterium]
MYGKIKHMADKDVNLRNIYLNFKGGVLDFKGTSMEPVLKEGQKVKVEPVKPEALRSGDIIVFGRGDILVCHRIMGRVRRGEKMYFYEKGDNSKSIGVISEDEVIGRAKYILKNGAPEKIKSCVTKKGFALYILDGYIRLYAMSAEFIKNRVFFGKKNFISHFLGTIAWKAQDFCFKLINRKIL